MNPAPLAHRDPWPFEVPGPLLQRPGSLSGPLAGLRFGIKDVFEVEGHQASCGNPDWQASHGRSQQTAPVVQTLLDAGASLDGCLLLDELCATMSGINPHHGIPPNPKAPGRLPGGSSGGSAAAVASGQVDFALGTDTSGSVRLPAAWCGVYGIRPSHRRLSAEGVFPLAPSFDTVGWMASTATVLRRVGEVLLAGVPSSRVPSGLAREESAVRLLVAVDALEWASPEVAQAVVEVVRGLAERGVGVEGVRLYDDMAAWIEAHTTGVHAECVAQHAAWFRSCTPNLGLEVAERFRDLEPPLAVRLEAARAFRRTARARMEALLDGPVLLCMPTSWDIALPQEAPREVCNEVELRSLVLGCVASLAGLCEVSCPWASVEGLPVGVSLLARPGADLGLLSQVEAWGSLLAPGSAG